MKFEKTEPEFSPIIITLESDVEAQALMATLSSVVGHGLDGEFLYNLYVKLDEQFTFRERMFRTEGQGPIHLKENS